MDKNIIKKYLNETFVSEASKSEANGTPAIKLAGKLAKDNKKVNKDGVEEIGKDMTKYEKSLTKSDANAKTMGQNKFNYADDEEKKYHDEMEIMNGQEMIQYDRTDEKFRERALEAIEGSSNMGNNSEWANVVAKGQGGDPKFGKNLAKKIKSSIKKRAEQTPTTKMFGDDWEVTKGEGHKKYALENENKNKPQIKEEFVGGVNYSNDVAAQLKQTVGSLDKLTPYVLEIGNNVTSDSTGAIHIQDENGRTVKKFIDVQQFLQGIRYRMNENKNKPQIKEEFVGGVNYSNDVAAQLKQTVGSLDKLTPYVLEIGNNVTSDSTGAIHIQDENGRTVKKFIDVQQFLQGIRYRMNENKNKPQIKESMKRLKFKKEFKGVGNALKMIPESYKVDNKVFEMTDGNESYKVRWEGNLTEGKAVILMAADKTMVNEDIKKMKHLMGYKSEDTLGTVKGKSRIDEDKAFADVWAKTKKIMESEDIEDQDAEKEAPFDEADIKQAPEAKKHVQGSVSTEKGTKAPKPKEGAWEEADVTQAPEAKKHVQGSVSTEKGTKAPAPKNGEWEKAKKGAAPEATKDVKKKSLSESELDDDDIDSDVPVKKRADAYDASLDVADPEDMAQSVSPSDIAKSTNAPKFVNKDVDGDDDIDIVDVDEPAQPNTETKLVSSKTRPGVFGIMTKVGGKVVGVEDVPPQYLELAKTSPNAALAKIKAEKRMASVTDDESLMEEIDKHFGITRKK
jgi:hypothetical protein